MVNGAAAMGALPIPGTEQAVGIRAKIRSRRRIRLDMLAAILLDLVYPCVVSPTVGLACSSALAAVTYWWV